MSATIAALFQRLTQGVYVIGVTDGTTDNAFTAAWVMQVSFDPLLLTLSINAHHGSYRLLQQSGTFTVNVLSREQMSLAAHFGQPAVSDKLGSVAWTRSGAGAPLITDAIAWFECRVIAEHPAGDHVLVLGRVVDGKLLAPEAEPLTYKETGALDGAADLFPDSFAKG